MAGALLGPQFEQAEIERRLSAAGARFAVVSEDDMVEAAARALAAEQAVGWFQGRMEFGPRALGARSILADPRSPSTQRNLNLKRGRRRLVRSRRGQSLHAAGGGRARRSPACDDAG
jgi:carbamoyltransferase